MYGRPYYYGRVGCLNGLLGLLFFPIVMLIIVAISFAASLGSVVTDVANGGRVEYSESAFQEYASEQYVAEFGESDSYETNLLIVFLTNEEADSYYCIAWIGDYVKDGIKDKFGNEYTEFGLAVTGSVANYYANSLSSNLASVMNKMGDSVVSEGLSSSFIEGFESDKSIPSHVTNYSNIVINEQTVNMALERFTERTDIPAVIVVDTAENVFGKTMPIGSIVITVALAVAVIVAIVLLVRAIRQRKNGNGGGGNNSGYDDGSGRTYDDGSGRSYHDGSDRQNW